MWLFSAFLLAHALIMIIKPGNTIAGLVLVVILLNFMVFIQVLLVRVLVIIAILFVLWV